MKQFIRVITFVLLLAVFAIPVAAQDRQAQEVFDKAVKVRRSPAAFSQGYGTQS